VTTPHEWLESKVGLVMSEVQMQDMGWGAQLLGGEHHSACYVG
jgi:hypothetical protein